MNIEVRLSVEDSPNSARGGRGRHPLLQAGPGPGRGRGGGRPSAYFCKHPPHQFTDDDAQRMVEEFIAGAPLEDRRRVKAVILAAGQGTRLRSIAASKPLAPVLGVPLIERVIDAAARGRRRRASWWSPGYEAEPLEAFLAELAVRRERRHRGRSQRPLAQIQRPVGRRPPGRGWTGPSRS